MDLRISVYWHQKYLFGSEPSDTFSVQLRVFTIKQIPVFTSLPSTFTAKKATKMIISADKIYYSFSHKYSKILNMQNTEIARQAL